MKRGILFGDSIREVYFPLVARRLETEFELWAPRENGGTSRNTLARLPEWLSGRTADVIHINCGLHDIASAGPGMPNNIGLAEYEENLRKIFALLRMTGARIVWATTTPVLIERVRKCGFERRKEDVVRYNAAAKAIAESFRVDVNDLYAVVVRRGVEACMTEDGSHMNEVGNPLVADAVVVCLRKQAQLGERTSQ